MRLLLALALAAVPVAGCGGDGGGTATSTDDAGASGTLVHYTRGGGIGATLVEVIVAEDGTATSKSGYPSQGQRVSDFSLTGAELADLNAAVEDALPLEVEKTDTICADCFEYEIEAAGETVSFDSVDLDQGNVSPEIGTLVDELETLAADHVKPPPAP